MARSQVYVTGPAEDWKYDSCIGCGALVAISQEMHDLHDQWHEKIEGR